MLGSFASCCRHTPGALSRAGIRPSLREMVQSRWLKCRWIRGCEGSRKSETNWETVNVLQNINAEGLN